VNNPNSRKQPISKSSAAPQNLPGHLATMPDTEYQEMIRARAYELYESRGRENGQDEDDWLRAEQEILKAGRR
jgi:Protein of unknown function (DUF2934)